MPVTVTTRWDHQPHATSEERLTRYAQQGRCVSDQFVVCKIGGMLMLKLTGFIEDERAEVLSVSEDHVTLLLGRPWYRRIGCRSTERRRPVEVHIQFAEPGQKGVQWQAANARRSVVEIRLRPLTPTFTTRDFHRRADAILRMLRLHFVAD